MQPSIFNVRVPLAERDEVFLMNTFTDAQLIVSRDVSDLLDRLGGDGFTPDLSERDAFTTLAENGFIVESREADRRNIEDFFTEFRAGQDQLRVTVLTTLQCNFACDYCIQGDHGEYNKTAAKMSMETAARVAEWIEGRMDVIAPKSFALTFFGGEPLLNLPVVYYLAERMSKTCRLRGVSLVMNVITNGLLLTADVVDRLTACGSLGVKVTLDGDRDTHNRMRPLRGGQGTFDKILNNIRQVADRCRISIGGNFDESSVDSYPALLDFLREQEFADKLTRGLLQADHPRSEAGSSRRGSSRSRPSASEGKPLNGTCMTSAGAGVSTSSGACDSCHFLDEQMSFLREETTKRGFKTVDGVHMGPCEIHKQHAHTIGPDGSLYACPGFAGNVPESTGHIDGRAGRVAERRGTAVREDHGVGGLQRLLVHPRVRGRLLCGRSHRARGHEQAELPQAQLRSRRRHAGPSGRTAAGAGLAMFQLWNSARISGRKEQGRERQERYEEKGNASTLAGGRFSRPPAVRLQVSRRKRDDISIRLRRDRS